MPGLLNRKTRSVGRRQTTRCLSAVFLLVVCMVPTTVRCEDAISSAAREQVATINGTTVSEADLAPLIAGQLQQLRQQEYDIKSQALEQLINKRLLEAEAAKQGLTVDQLTEQEVMSKFVEPTEAEVEAYYLGQKDKIQRPLSTVRPQLHQSLRQAKAQQAMEEYLSRLKTNAKIQIALHPPRVKVGDDPKRARGNANAAVSIVEFSDYHCPFCKRAELVVQEVMAKYDGRVRLVYRDFPLDNLHPRARAAAEAANCAGDQGKFWEYHDALFLNAPKASRDDLKGYATTVGLDAAQFEQCLTQNTHRSLVQQDVEEATKLGLSGTPAFFINGRFLNGAQPLEKFVQIIDEELARAEPDTVSMRKQ